MATVNNPVIGTIGCQGCGGTATVHQTRRGKDRFHYTRCQDCGVDQRNGAKVQTRLFYHTDWRDGIVVDRPPNVKEEEKKPVVEPEEPSNDKELSGVQLLKETTEQEPKPQPIHEPKHNRREPSKTPLFLALGLGLAAVLVR